MSAVVSVMSQGLRASALATGLGLGLGVALVLAACGSVPQAGQSSSSPSTRSSGSASASSSPSVSASASPSCQAASGTASAPAGNPPGTVRPTLNAVQFVSASDGWVVGSNRILHTSDGGLHWVTQFVTSPSAGLANLDFTDASHGWVVGETTVLATADGGAHWHALPEPCVPIRAVHFFSPSDGVAVADSGALTIGFPPSTGGVLLSTTDGGQHWQPLPAPANVQSVCFTNASHGWLGAGGNIYGTADGGRTWTLAVRGPHPAGGGQTFFATAEVQCAGPAAAWAQLIGPGAGMSHQPQLGYHTFGQAWRPIFAELYFPHSGVHVKASAAGPEGGPFSAISPAQAVFIGFCAPCSSLGTPQLQGTAPMDIATNGGAMLVSRGAVADLAQANGAAFVSVDSGWVVGTQTRYPLHRKGHIKTVSRIMHTADGGRTWQVQYVLGP